MKKLCKKALQQIGDHLERFTTLMKNSESGNDLKDSNFVSEFVKNSKLLKQQNLTIVSGQRDLIYKTFYGSKQFLIKLECLLLKVQGPVLLNFLRQ